jgi:peptidoglycan/LPS O-acetylase OafA/YrhL
VARDLGIKRAGCFHAPLLAVDGAEIPLMLSRVNTTSDQLSHGERLRQLDVLRAVAIVLVLMHHSNELLAPAGVFAGLVRFAENFGWTGVDLFFVLSGFLIGGLLFREIDRTGKFRIGRFLIRRGFKIWPGYFALVAYVEFRLVRHGESVSHVVALYWANLLQIQNYTRNIRSLTWSLAVEEHFYLLLPVALAVMLWRGGREWVRKNFMAAAWVVIGATATFRTIHGIYWPYSMDTHYFPTHIRIDALLFGVVLAHIATFSPGLWTRLLAWKWALMATGIVLISPMLFLDHNENAFVWTGGFSLLYLGYGSLMIAMLAVKPGVGWDGRLLVSPVGRFLSWMGLYSYGIYLWHVDLAARPVAIHLQGLWMRMPLGMGWAAAMVTFMVVAVLAGVVMTMLIEWPFMALRSKLYPARGEAAAVETRREAAAVGGDGGDKKIAQGEITGERKMRRAAV